MNDERLERLLRGYRLPDVSRSLDERVLREGAAILTRAHFLAQAGEIGLTVLQRLGFGYLALLFDLVTRTDAVYSVDYV